MQPVRLRIGKPTFNSGSKQSYYSTVFRVKEVVKSKHPQKAIRYRLEGGKSSAANVKLLAKSYVQRYLLPVGKVEGGDKFVVRSPGRDYLLEATKGDARLWSDVITHQVSKK